MKYIISLSGGNNSLNCLDYCIKKFGKENVVAIFADNNFEHHTLYEGLYWIENYFDIKINIVKNNNYLNPVDCNFKRHLIWHSAVRCTEETKIKPIKEWIFKNFPNKNEYYMVLGYNTTEIKRIEKAVKFQEKAKEYNLFFPAIQEDWKPISYVDWRDLFGFPEQHVYEKGGRSNNCSGGCFKMSRQSWYLLYKNDREEFNKWCHYEQYIHNEIIRNRKEKYGDNMNLLKTKENEMWINKKMSLKELSEIWDSGVIPKMNKREQPLGKCKQNGTECGFSL